MAQQRTLLRPVTQAIHQAEHLSDLRERVCEAAVSAGYEAACYFEDEALRAAAGPNGAHPPVDDLSPEFTTVDADGWQWALVPVAYGETQYGTLALATVDPVEDETRRERLVGVG